ncbi:DNA repair helicase XPB [Paenibacillus sp. J2TS4]|uniref:DNA repair helicase XPB n=1 Tax=Paenibacillus sp. J2TS4 TaxID=2807194 RepID=UPI001B2BBAD9|nr:DNA repair helicase XPB [Paenibacillus sp. J2TS4]GIP32923.1 DEAD/DEAH box helicase [Paenibacillus sp. J2TS4]
MNSASQSPLFILNDFTVLLETDHPDFETVRNRLNRFADLVKSPPHIHTYKITPLSLWNAMACGWRPGEMIDFLTNYSKFGIPSSVRNELLKITDKYGLLQLEQRDGALLLLSKSPALLNELMSYPSLSALFGERIDPQAVEVRPSSRGKVKQELIHLGYPLEDRAGFHQGESLALDWRDKLSDGRTFELRDYQAEAVEAFYREGSTHGGSGVLILPCGAGKTIIGIAAVCKLQCATLILTPNVSSVKQWKREIMEKTTLDESMIGEYDGTTKLVKPVTIATYQILTHRRSKEDEFRHMKLFKERDWGLIIYDEVHLLPAPIFRVTADIQATRRLGLTATLVREDGCEKEVYSLIGPKRYDVPWKQLEKQGWIAQVECKELLVDLPRESIKLYKETGARSQMRVAAENPRKMEVAAKLLVKHKGEPTLVIGQYLEQLRKFADYLQAPLICGTMPHEEREKLYQQFREGLLPVLVVSKVANFAVDLPDASVAIQVSGSFGSRQEEAQRLGRILRPKPGRNKSYFYSIVSKGTKEQEFALNRQLFLIEQGYQYSLIEGEWEGQEVEV